MATRTQARKSDRTRKLILDTALRLFRKSGFEEATLRDIAAAAGISLGSTYYYFESKESIIGAYYEFVQSEYLARAKDALAVTPDFRARLAAVLHAKLDVLKDDRKILSGLFRYGGDPSHPLSWFGRQTEHIRRSSMGVMVEVAEVLRMPPDARRVTPTMLWALEMGVLLYFVHDGSVGQWRTRKLVDGVAALIGRMAGLIVSPFAKPLRSHGIRLLRDAQLLAEPSEALL
ncbi:MAG TPA: TetR/AcrR family transcriptional regulator [Candidatus Eremiobacteraceae bacterium]|nr:TetR/AcrR family transcriptional regulator [Candidatus Eremiobacteraceae bacterium]